MDVNLLHDTALADALLAPPVRPSSGIVPVILAGGSGSRLWPLSRDSLPKQFLPLASQRTLLQEAALCAHGLQPDGACFAPPLILCHQDHRFLTAAQLAAIGITDRRIVVEPVSRNSAPALCAAALLVAEDDPDALVWVMAADSVFADLPALHRYLPAAMAAARDGRMVTFGIQPTAPGTGGGQIEPGEALPGAPGAQTILRFVAKPSGQVAAGLPASGRYLQNCGMFLFTARTLLREMAQHAPAVLAQVTLAVQRRRQDPDFIRLDAESFAACPSLSLDHAVAERTSLGAVVPAELPWRDVGSWDALWQASDKDAAGNCSSGDALLHDSARCYVRSAEGVVTAVIGLEDAIVISTGDAVLALHRDHAQDVRQIVQRLRSMGHAQARQHSRCERPWGFYETLRLGDRFQVKRIVVQPGQKLSLQKHFHRAEHWVVVEGTALVTRDAEEVMLQENETIYLPLGCIHRLANPGRIPLTIIEVQLGAYLGEDDIVRLEDAFGRC